MSEFFQSILPRNSNEILGSLYEGAVYLLPANRESLELTNAACELLSSRLGESFEDCHECFGAEEFFSIIGKLRKRIYTGNDFHQRINEVINSVGVCVEEQVYDPARLRVVQHLGHLNESAAAVYYGHRDTWYANSQSMITWWIPLVDVGPERSFVFYPDAFGQVVQNDSEVFDFDDWVSQGEEKRIGWQHQKTGSVATYPRLKEAAPAKSISVKAKRGEILLFSAQHLHQTTANCSGKTRFSLDFRTVSVGDHAIEKGAVNVDNRSTGSSMQAFVIAKEVAEEVTKRDGAERDDGKRLNDQAISHEASRDG